jgi:hypothetical protein
MNKVPENAWEVVGTVHFISKEIILMKKKMVMPTQGERMP